jgi:hypothetical protein
MDAVTWRKASLSTDNGEMCVEVAVIEGWNAPYKS